MPAVRPIQPQGALQPSLPVPRGLLLRQKSTTSPQLEKNKPKYNSLQNLKDGGEKKGFPCNGKQLLDGWDEYLSGGVFLSFKFGLRCRGNAVLQMGPLWPFVPEPVPARVVVGVRERGGLA